MYHMFSLLEAYCRYRGGGGGEEEEEEEEGSCRNLCFCFVQRGSL